MILSDLLPDVLGRIEEANPPVFWNLTGEVYPSMVDALFEAALFTGLIQIVNVPVTLDPGSTYYIIQGPGGFGQGTFGNLGFGAIVPQGIIAPTRMVAPYMIRKTTLKALDDYTPGWQQEAPSTQIKAWFPLGTTFLGIYPQLSVQATITMDFLVSPVNKARPYDGSETIPLQQEFLDTLTQYAAASLRAKEAGAEAEEADVVFQEFMAKMKQLSAFQQRVDSLVYSPAFGAGMLIPNARKVV